MSHDPTARLVAALEAGGFDPKAKGQDAWESRCPSHSGTRHNLSIKRGDDGRVLVKCHHSEGCSHRAVAEALGLSESDLFPPRDDRRGKPPTNGHAGGNGKARRPHPAPEAALRGATREYGEPTGHHLYHEADGAEAFRVFRFDFADSKKTYRPVHPTHEGWVAGDPPGPLPLYRLPELAGADRVFVCEGEKCVDALRRLGLSATTSAHGARSAYKSDWGPLAGREVVILPDRDGPGEGYRSAVVGVLAKLDPRPTVKVVRLPEMWRSEAPIPAARDVVDWIRDGVPHSWEPEQCRAELERLAGAATPIDLDAPVAPKAEAEPPRPRVKLVRASDVRCLPVEWLWPGRVPFGMLTLFSGDPKTGKSLTSLWLAGAASRGEVPGQPGESTPPRDVILMSAEDDAARTVVPRLKAADADLSRIHVLESVFLADGAEALPSLKTDLDAIEAAVASVPDCGLIVVDPVSAYLGGPTTTGPES